MPIPEERLYRPDRLNRWFAVAAILMTVSFGWMIWADYDRPWRGFQDNYFVVKAALFHLNYLDSLREERVNEIDEARQRLQDAQQFVAESSGSRRDRLNSELVEAELQFKKANSVFSQKSQVLEVTRDSYEKTLAANGYDDPQTIDARRILEDGQNRVEDLKLEKEKWQDETRRIKFEIKAIDEPVRTADKSLSDLMKIRDDALEKDQQFRGVLTDEGVFGGLPVVKAVIHAPLLDFVAPKTTSGRQQVKQLVLPDVRQRLNYLDSYTTDRCTTCHIAIDDPDFAQGTLAARLEDSISGIDEAMVRIGLSPIGHAEPPVLEASGQKLPEGQVAQYWDRLTSEQRNAYFDELVGNVNRYMEASGRKPIKLGHPILAHPDLDLYVSVESPHPMASMGCTVCHEGNPQETDFVQAAHTPPTHEAQEEWEEKYYIEELGVPNITFETVAHYWDRPMRLPSHTEAGCTKCHSQITDIANFDGDRHGEQINLGRQLFQQVGCINCHNVDELNDARRVGPSLQSIADKLTPEFTQQWVWFPQKFRPSTRMPHFFSQENNNEDSENEYDPHPVLRTETEVAAITHYLFSVSQPWEPIRKPETVQGDPQRGKALFTQVGCQGCHSNLALSGQEWITRDLQQREGIDEQTAYHRFMGMTYEDRTMYAMKHFPSPIDSVLHPDEVRFEGDDTYKPPVFSRFAPELSAIGSKVSFDWLYSWLIEPRHYAEDTIMPSLRLSPEEAADIASYLLTLKNDAFPQEQFVINDERQDEVEHLLFTLLSAQRSARRSRAIINDQNGELSKMLKSLVSTSLGEEKAYELISPMTLEQKQLMYLGNKTIAHYGCYTCHTIAGFEETTPVGTDLSTWAEKPIAQLDFAFYDHAFHHMRHEKDDVYGYLYRPESTDLRKYSPADDDQREQVTHTHGAFAKHKFLNPRIWDREKIKRPYDKLKMPNFYFTAEEADALVTFMLSRVPARVNDNLKVAYETSNAGDIAEGRWLTRELNCVGCHQFEDNAPMVQQYFRREIGGETTFDEVNAPPRLWGQGAKVQPDWMHGFFANVETLRPWLQIRMPSFNLTQKEANDLTAYFASLSQYNAAKLKDAHAPVVEYIGEAQKNAAASEKETAVAGSDWHQDELLNDHVEQLRRFGIDRKLIRANDFDVLNRSAKRVGEAHAKLLDRTQFMEKLYDIEYPFGEPPITLSSDERFEMGGRFFIDMGCLKCHVLGPMEPGPASNTDQFVQTYRLDAVRGEGDGAVAIINGERYKVGTVIDGHTLVSAENVFYDSGDIETSAVFEGPNADGETERIQLQAPSAPDLGLTFKRLRRNWFLNWMLLPQLIQPGTKMPQNFPGGESPYEGDPNYPGTGMDHIHLLTDYVYEAGIRGTRVPLTKVVVTEEVEEFDEDGGSFDDEFDEDEFD